MFRRMRTLCLRLVKLIKFIDMITYTFNQIIALSKEDFKATFLNKNVEIIKDQTITGKVVDILVSCDTKRLPIGFILNDGTEIDVCVEGCTVTIM